MGKLVGVHGIDKQPRQQPAAYPQYIRPSGDDEPIPYPWNAPAPDFEVKTYAPSQEIEQIPNLAQEDDIASQLAELYVDEDVYEGEIVDDENDATLPTDVDDEESGQVRPLTRSERKAAKQENLEAWKADHSRGERAVRYLGKSTIVWVMTGLAFGGIMSGEHKMGLTGNTTYSVSSPMTIAKAAAKGPISPAEEVNKMVVQPMIVVGKVFFHIGSGAASIVKKL